MTFPARSASGKRLAYLMDQYVLGLNRTPEYQFVSQLSEAEIAKTEIEAFIQWLEDNDHR